MCRIPKVLVVAPSPDHLALRRALSSLEYDIVATVEPDATNGITADIAVLAQTAPGLAATLREQGVKTAGVDPDVDLVLEDVASFKERLWELYRAK